RSESGVDFTLAAGIGHEDLLANRVCCALQFVQLARNIRAARMRKGSDQGGVRNEFTQQPKALGSEILNPNVGAGQIGLGSVQARDQTGSNRVEPYYERNWDRRGRGLGG